MEMRRRLGATFSITSFIERVYKAFGFWCSELKARLLEARAREEGLSIVVYEKEIVREVAT